MASRQQANAAWAWKKDFFSLICDPFSVRQTLAKSSIMKKQAEFNLSIEGIDTYDLETIEEKLLYIRYLIRREQKEFKLIKLQYIIDSLERRKEFLRALQTGFQDNGAGKPE
jgi:hypothetical protein